MTMPQGQMPGPLPMAQPQPSGATPSPSGALQPPSPAASSTLGSMAPKEAAVRTQTGASVPAPTDDPAVVGTGTPKGGLSSYLSMPQLPTPPDYSNSPVTAAYQTYQDTMAKRFGMQPPTPANYRPGLMDRLKGGLVGALVGGLSENADKGSEAGKRFTYSKYNRAAGEYGRTAGNLDKQLEAERGGAGLAEAAGKIPQTDFENRMQVSKEGREQQTAITNAQAKEDLNNIRQEWNQDREKNNQEKNAAYLQHITDLENKYKDDAAMREELFHLRERVEDFKETKGDKAKPSQSVGIEAKKATALQKAKAAYDKETELAGSDSEARATAETNFKQAQQDAQDAYEAEINAAGGEAQHQDVESWRGKPAVKPATPGTTPATAPAANDEGAPTVMGPKGETPTQTANNGKTKIGFYKSTGQWMLVPNSTGGR